MAMTETEKDARIAKLEAELHRMHRRHSEMAQYAAFWQESYIKMMESRAQEAAPSE
jgi:hypothetical protein